MRFRITARADDIELRGYIDDEDLLESFSRKMNGLALVIASVADDDYDPFRRQGIPIEEVWQMQADVILGERALREVAESELKARELHHFETEQMIERVIGVLDAEVGWENPALLRDTIRRALEGPLNV